MLRGLSIGKPPSNAINVSFALKDLGDGVPVAIIIDDAMLLHPGTDGYVSTLGEIANGMYIIVIIR